MAAPKRTTPQAGLSPKFIDTLRPDATTYEVGDRGEHKGLRLCVSSSGARWFVWYVKDGEKRRKITLGSYPATSLSDARTLLRDYKQAHREKRLVQLLEPVTVEAKSGAPTTVRDLAPDFMATLRRRRRRPEEAQAVLDKDVLPLIGDKAVAAVTSDDVEKIVVKVVDRKATTYAGKVLQITKQFFRYAESKGKITRNPATALHADDLGIVNRQRDRVLDDPRERVKDEIAAFWKALDGKLTPTVRNALRLLLLLGVRTGELLQATWDEIDFNETLPNGQPKPEADRKPTWTIPVAHQKLTRKQERAGAKAFRVPLPPTAVAILRELRAFADSLGSRYVLASFAQDKGKKRGGPTSEKALSHAMRGLFEGESPALALPDPRPTPHDLRRTVRSHLVALGVPPHVAEKCLNHSLGRVFQTYDVGDYLDERRAALARWDAYLSHLVTGKGADVVAHPAAVRS